MTTTMTTNSTNDQNARTFNPQDHMIQLKSREGSKDYLPVQWRLVWFREQCPQGTIDTEEVVVDLDREVEEESFAWNAEKRKSEKVVKHARGYARFRAVVTDGRGGRATGTKSENAASFPDFIEKAESGAIGRALAALGYGTQFAAEFDEGSVRIVDSPVDRGQAPSGNNTAPGGNTGVNPGNTGSPHGNESAQRTPDRAAAPAGESAPEGITERQQASVRKLSEHLRKALPEDLSSYSFDRASKLIQQLNVEYKESRSTATAQR